MFPPAIPSLSYKSNLRNTIIAKELTLYRARTVSIHPGMGRPRTFSWVDLRKLLSTQICLVNAQCAIASCPEVSFPCCTHRALGLMQAQKDIDDMHVGKARVVVCADATSMWRSSATRCDVYIDLRRTVEGTLHV